MTTRAAAILKADQLAVTAKAKAALATLAKAAAAKADKTAIAAVKAAGVAAVKAKAAKAAIPKEPAVLLPKNKLRRMTGAHLVDPLTLTGTPIVAAEFGADYSFTVTAHGGRAPYVFELVGGYPAGIDATPSGLADAIIAGTLPLGTTDRVLTLINPGFETGDLTGWVGSNSGIWPTVGSNAHHVVTSFDGNSPHDGTYFVTAGAEQQGYLFQIFDVTADATLVDAGGVTLDGLAGWHNNIHDGQLDTGWLNLWCLNGAGAVILDHHLAATEAVAAWEHLTLASHAIPAGTREIRTGFVDIRSVGPTDSSDWDSFTPATLHGVGAQSEFTPLSVRVTDVNGATAQLPNFTLNLYSADELPGGADDPPWQSVIDAGLEGVWALKTTAGPRYAFLHTPAADGALLITLGGTITVDDGGNASISFAGTHVFDRWDFSGYKVLFAAGVPQPTFNDSQFRKTDLTSVVGYLLQGGRAGVGDAPLPQFNYCDFLGDTVEANEGDLTIANTGTYQASFCRFLNFSHNAWNTGGSAILKLTDCYIGPVKNNTAGDIHSEPIHGFGLERIEMLRVFLDGRGATPTPPAFVTAMGVFQQTVAAHNKVESCIIIGVADQGASAGPLWCSGPAIVEVNDSVLEAYDAGGGVKKYTGGDSGFFGSNNRDAATSAMLDSQLNLPEFGGAGDRATFDAVNQTPEISLSAANAKATRSAITLGDLVQMGAGPINAAGGKVYACFNVTFGNGDNYQRIGLGIGRTRRDKPLGNFDAYTFAFSSYGLCYRNTLNHSGLPSWNFWAPGSVAVAVLFDFTTKQAWTYIGGVYGGAASGAPNAVTGADGADFSYLPAVDLFLAYQAHALNDACQIEDVAVHFAAQQAAWEGAGFVQA